MLHLFSQIILCFSFSIVFANFIHDTNGLGQVHRSVHAIEVLERALYESGFRKNDAEKEFESQIQHALPQKYSQKKPSIELLNDLVQELVVARKKKISDTTVGEIYNVLLNAFAELPWDARLSAVDYDPADIVNRIRIVLDKYVLSNCNYVYAKKALFVLKRAESALSQDEKNHISSEYNTIVKAYLKAAFLHAVSDVFFDSNFFPLLTHNGSRYLEEISIAQKYWDEQISRITIGSVPLQVFEKTLEKLQKVYEKMPKKRYSGFSDTTKKGIVLGLTGTVILLLATYGFMTT